MIPIETLISFFAASALLAVAPGPGNLFVLTQSALRGAISLQLLLLGGVFIIATILVFGGIALLAGILGRWLNRSTRVQNIMSRGAGTVFVCLALRLATTKQ